MKLTMKRSASAPALTILCAALTAFLASTATADDDGFGELPAAAEEAPGSPQCQGVSGLTPAVEPVLRIPLAVHVGGSVADDAELCSIVDEINEIMLTQTGVCFEMEIDQVFVNTGNPRTDRTAEKRPGMLNLWLLGSGMLFPTSQTSNGVYLGAALDEAYSLDRPSLSTDGVLIQTRNAAARTGAHELGHALSLQHQDCGADCNNLLMRSGHRGFELTTGTPANVNEIQRARANAMNRLLRAGLPASVLCAPPRFVE